MSSRPAGATDNWRLFVQVPAPPLDAEQERQLSRYLQTLTDARPTRPAMRHLTLLFLGELPRRRCDEVAAACAAAAEAVASWRFSLDTLSGFPRARAARIVALRGETPPAARALHAALCTETARRGISCDARPLTLHLTLARLRRPQTAPPEGFAALCGEADAMQLMCSRLLPQGAVHEVCARFPLGGSQRGSGS